MPVTMDNSPEPISGVCECGAELKGEDQYDDGMCFECWLEQFRIQGS